MLEVLDEDSMLLVVKGKEGFVEGVPIVQDLDIEVLVENFSIL